MASRGDAVAQALRGSFWFLPAVLAIAAAALMALAAWADRSWSPGDVFGDGQSLLAMLAGGTLTVTGVVFSVTILTLSLASNQFGPRVLRAFTRDRTSHVALGVLIATFVYCTGALALGPPGVVSIAGALALGATSVAVLIGFIHHITVVIQADSVLQHMAGDCRPMLERWFPEDASDEQPPDVQGPLTAAIKGGYVQRIDEAALLERAQAPVRVLVRVGDRVLIGDPVLVGGGVEGLERHVVIGPRRADTDDLLFQFSQIAEMAVRALSPGINDPATARQCIDELLGLLHVVVDRPTRPTVHRSGGAVLVVQDIGFDELLTEAFGEVTPHANGHPWVQERILTSLARLHEATERGDRRDAIARRARAVLAEGHVDGPWPDSWSP